MHLALHTRTGLGSEGDSPASMEMAKFAALGEGTGAVVVDANDSDISIHFGR